MFADRAAKSAREDPWEEREESTNPKQALDAEREREREREKQQALGVYDEASYRPIFIFVYTANNWEAGLSDRRP